MSFNLKNFIKEKPGKYFLFFLLVFSLLTVPTALTAVYFFVPMNCEVEVSPQKVVKIKLERLRTGFKRVDNKALIESGSTTSASIETITGSNVYGVIRK